MMNDNYHFILKINITEPIGYKNNKIRATIDVGLKKSYK